MKKLNAHLLSTSIALLLAGNKLSDNELNTLGDLIGEQDIEPRGDLFRPGAD